VRSAFLYPPREMFRTPFSVPQPFECPTPYAPFFAQTSKSRSISPQNSKQGPVFPFCFPSSLARLSRSSVAAPVRGMLRWIAISCPGRCDRERAEFEVSSRLLPRKGIVFPISWTSSTFPYPARVYASVTVCGEVLSSKLLRLLPHISLTFFVAPLAGTERLRHLFPFSQLLES